MQSLTCPGLVSVDSSGLVASCSEAWHDAPFFPLTADQLNELVLAVLGLLAFIWCCFQVLHALDDPKGD